MAKENEEEDEYEEDYSGEEDFEQSSGGKLEVATGESRAQTTVNNTTKGNNRKQISLMD